MNSSRARASLFVLSFAIAAGAVSACSSDDDSGIHRRDSGVDDLDAASEETPDADLDATVDASTDAPPPTDLQEEGVAKVLLDFHARQIEHADLARDRAQDSVVRSLARSLKDAHQADSDHLNATLKTLAIVPSVSTISIKVNTDANARLKDLQARAINDFDLAFLQDQVAAETFILDRLTSQLLPAAKRLVFRAELEVTRSNETDHLDVLRSTIATLFPDASIPDSGPEAGGPDASGTDSSPPADVRVTDSATPDSSAD